MSRLLGILLVLSVSVPVATDASGARPKPRKVPRTPESAFFSDAGDFSGTLAGSIALNGTQYWLSPDAKIYEVGRGALPQGTSLSHRMVFVSGAVRGSSKIVRQVMVRPGFAGLGDPGNITEADEARPR